MEQDLLADAIDPSFRSVAEGVTDNIILLDPTGRIRYINYTVPDLSVAAVIGTSVYEHVPPAYRTVMRRCHERVLATSTPDRYETAYESDDGEVSWWESRVSPVIRDGRVVGLVQISSNVTERRRAAADRDHLFNLSLDMLCVAGTDGYLRRVNPAFTRTLGYDEHELLAQPFAEFIHPDDREATGAAVARLARGEPVIDFDNRYRCRDGTYRWLSWRAAPDAAGKSIYAVARDVTARRDLEEQLRRSQKMDTVGQLAGGIAHDFNNLVTAIDLNIQLATSATDARRRNHYFDEVRLATQRAADLTRQLLAVGRRPGNAPEALDLNEVTHNMLSLLRRLIPENVEIALELSESLPSIRADMGQVEQVILNLCLNARDAMPDGGRLVIATALSAATPTGPHGVGAGPLDRVALRVDDTGVGMGLDVRERVFEPFFTTKEPGRGTGLGLAIVYGIVLQHGGQVSVVSEVGQGSRFEVLWPATPERARPTGVPRPHEVAGGRETILVAEDEAGVRGGVVDILQTAGYRVLAAEDGQAALRLFEAHAPEIALAVLDVVMPRLGGPAAALRMRAQRPALAVLFTSGYDLAGGPGAASVPHATRLDKPYATQDLLRTVRALLDRRPAPG